MGDRGSLHVLGFSTLSMCRYHAAFSCRLRSELRHAPTAGGLQSVAPGPCPACARLLSPSSPHIRRYIYDSLANIQAPRESACPRRAIPIKVLRFHRNHEVHNLALGEQPTANLVKTL